MVETLLMFDVLPLLASLPTFALRLMFECCDSDPACENDVARDIETPLFPKPLPESAEAVVGDSAAVPRATMAVKDIKVGRIFMFHSRSCFVGHPLH